MFRTEPEKWKVLYNLGLLYKRALNGEEVGVADVVHREAGVKKAGEKLDRTHRKGKRSGSQAQVCLCLLFLRLREVYEYLKVDGTKPVNRKMEEGRDGCEGGMICNKDTGN